MKKLLTWPHRIAAGIYDKPGRIWLPFWTLAAFLDLLDILGVFRLVDSPSLASLPDALELWIILIWLAAGVFYLISTYPHKIVSREWLWERLAWTSSGFGWIAYGIAILTRNPRSLLVWGSMACLGLMSLIYFSKVKRHEKSVRNTVENIRRENENA